MSSISSMLIPGKGHKPNPRLALIFPDFPFFPRWDMDSSPGRVHPRKTNMEPKKMEVWKMMFLFNRVIFRFYVSFRGSISPEAILFNQSTSTMRSFKPSIQFFRPFRIKQPPIMSQQGCKTR